MTLHRKLVWPCPYCGLLTSKRTLDKHRVCHRLMDEEASGYHWQYGVVQGAGKQ